MKLICGRPFFFNLKLIFSPGPFVLGMLLLLFLALIVSWHLAAAQTAPSYTDTLPSCFSKSEISALNIQPAVRTGRLTLERDGWSGHYITTSIAALILKVGCSFEPMRLLVAFLSRDVSEFF